MIFKSLVETRAPYEYCTGPRLGFVALSGASQDPAQSRNDLSENPGFQVGIIEIL